MISRQVEARTDERHLEEQRLQNDLIKKNSHTFNYVLSYEFTGITRMGLEHFRDIFFSAKPFQTVWPPAEVSLSPSTHLTEYNHQGYLQGMIKFV